MRGQHRLRRLLARHRRSPLVTRLHNLAVFIDDACSNVGLDIADDGELDLLRRLVPLGFRTAVDAGAHTGDWSLRAAECWPAVAIHAFEVAPETYRRLDAAVSVSSARDRIVLNECGLGESTGTAQMYYYPEVPELTADCDRHSRYSAVPFEARLVAGDEYVAARNLAAIDFLKIDVEGAEARVLRGFDHTIRRGAVRCIQFEYGAFAIDTRVLLRDYYEMLQDRYVIGKVFPRHVDLRDYAWTDEDFRFGNFLCVARGEPDLQRLARGEER